ncbi:hypothetical protein [Nocardioides sp. YIM 152588]|uniref:hypothetical protein n=1 Tax=Nocardioides sp. YIM 152588 TaxID=3158259 RepID=UPI0032E41EAC
MPRPSHRRWLVIALATAVVAGAAVVAVAVVRRVTDTGQSRLATAMELAPADAVRFTWTDWASVREELGSPVSAATPAEDLDDFLDAAFDADLSPMSTLVSSTPVLQDEYGVSPASLDWELYAQSRAGAVLLLGLPEALDLDELRVRLGRLGYAVPDEADGVWDGGGERLAGIGPVTPELTYLRIDDEHRVLAASDQRATVAALDGSVRGDEDTTAGTSSDGSAGGVSAAVGALGDVRAAAVYSGDYACVALSMTQADTDDQAEAARLVDEAGGVHPLDGFAIGTAGDGDLRVALALESEEAAREDADSRSVLAAGPAPGQGGTFPERFRLGEVVADGRVVTLDLAPEPRTFVLSDLSAGPVLFATC